MYIQLFDIDYVRRIINAYLNETIVNTYIYDKSSFTISIIRIKNLWFCLKSNNKFSVVMTISVWVRF